jgi:hypothetical protein
VGVATCAKHIERGEKCQLITDILRLKGQFQVLFRQLFRSNEACSLPKAYGETKLRPYN